VAGLTTPGDPRAPIASPTTPWSGPSPTPTPRRPRRGDLDQRRRLPTWSMPHGRSQCSASPAPHSPSP